jgi:hypothetical protein
MKKLLAFMHALLSGKTVAERDEPVTIKHVLPAPVKTAVIKEVNIVPQDSPLVGAGYGASGFVFHASGNVRERNNSQPRAVIEAQNNNRSDDNFLMNVALVNNMAANNDVINTCMLIDTMIL